MNVHVMFAAFAGLAQKPWSPSELAHLNLIACYGAGWISIARAFSISKVAHPICQNLITSQARSLLYLPLLTVAPKLCITRG